MPLLLPQSNWRLSTGVPRRRESEFSCLTHSPRERNMRAATLNVFLIISTLVMSSVPANAATETTNALCPKNDAAVVILSKHPYCAAHHLSGDACQARWEAYWSKTDLKNRFLAECRMLHWPEHKT